MLQQNQRFRTPKFAKTSLFNQTSKRFFTPKVDRALENLIARLPNGNLGYLMVGLNTAGYLAYLLWPRNRMHTYLANWCIYPDSLRNGHIHTFITAHFGHQSFLSYALDSVILYLFCQNTQLVFGNLFPAKVMLLSLLVANFLMFFAISTGSNTRLYQGNDALLRGLIFSVIFTNPQASFYLIPLPIQIKAWVIACVILGLDFLSFNVAGFGGVGAAYLMLNVI